MRTHAFALVLLAAASLAALVLFDLAERSSATALAALPWVGWAAFSSPHAVEDRPGAPQGAASARAAGWHALGYLGFAAPFVSAGAAFDLARGVSRSHVTWIGVVVALSVLLPAFASARAARDQRATSVITALCLLVWIVVPMAVFVLESVGGPAFGSAPRWAHVAASASPIAWTIERLLPGTGSFAGTVYGSAPPLLVCVLVAFLATRDFAHAPSTPNRRGEGS